MNPAESLLSFGALQQWAALLWAIAEYDHYTLDNPEVWFGIMLGCVPQLDHPTTFKYDSLSAIVVPPG